MIYQRSANAASNPLPTPSNDPANTPPIYPLGVGRADAGLEDPAAPPTPANDNREPRRVQNWPTGKRLLQYGRHEDHAMLLAYRGLLDMAWGEPDNDGWRNPAPARGHGDSRAMEERIGQRDMILDEDSILPSVDQLRELSGVPWGEEREVGACRPLVTWIDTAGVRLHTLGGLEFNDGKLWLYGDMSKDRRLLKKPSELRRPHRAPRSDPTIAVSTDGWSLDDQITAREAVQTIWEGLPASSVRILEHAIGSTTAKQLGEAFRKSGKNAQRFGVRLIDRAIDHLRHAWRPQIARQA